MKSVRGVKSVEDLKSMRGVKSARGMKSSLLRPKTVALIFREALVQWAYQDPKETEVYR